MLWWLHSFWYLTYNTQTYNTRSFTVPFTSSVCLLRKDRHGLPGRAGIWIQGCLTAVRRTNLHPNLATPHSKLATPHSNLVTPHSNLVTPQSNLATPHSNLASLHPNWATPHPNLATTHLNLATPHPITPSCCGEFHTFKQVRLATESKEAGCIQ